MDRFTIRDIENLCRIRAHTLRTWEQRYHLCVARRKSSQHRIYDNEDLKRILQISFLYHSGVKISRIAQLDPEGIQQAVRSACANQNEEAQLVELLSAGLDFDRSRFEELLRAVIQRQGLERSLQRVLFPLLERIGLLWLTDHVIPGQEHFVSHLVRKQVILATDRLKSPVPGRDPLIIFAPRGEHHEIPLLVVNYIFRKNGYPTRYFGTDIPLESVRKYLECGRAAAVYTHIITPLKVSASALVESLTSFRPGMRVFISGPGLAGLEMKPGVRVISSLEALGELARSEII